MSRKYTLGALVALLVLSSLSLQSVPAHASSCTSGDSCVVGDVGPGGGFIVYVSPTLQPWGRYIEAAPKGWYLNRKDPQIAPFCPERPSYEKGRLLQTGTAIGQGRANSLSLALICPTGAPAIAMEYSGGGLKDWFLPSRGDLNEMYYANTLLKFDQSWYWSSSTTEIHQVASLFVPEGAIKGDLTSSNDFAIRPVRYFSSSADKAAQAAADKAAADKAAADKAAADKAAADRAAAAEQAAADRAAAAEQAAADRAAAAEQAAADRAAAAKAKKTITCIKGKVSKKVTAIKPKCPSGYKVKK